MSLTRIIDIAFSAVLLTLTLPITIFIFILGYLETGSPFFTQQRVGKSQKTFTIIKFRTMAVRTESVATHLVDTSSITRLGRFLRSTKLDELPQMYNVLVGDMSFVGPRPCLTSQTEVIYNRELRGVFNLTPGITGLSQIHNVDMSTPLKLSRYDRVMVDNYSLRLYIYCFYKTALGAGQGDKINS